MTPVSYLALGDSYTVGEQVVASAGFPVQAVAILRQKGYQVADPQIVATTGWTTDELEQGIKAANIHQTFDIVTLLIGVNDQYRGRSVTAYEAAFTLLLNEAVRFAGNRPSHVIVLSIPDWSVTPFAADRNRSQVAAEIDAFNVVNKAISAQMQAAYLDITPFTREAARDKSLLAADGLHPSGKDYRRWAEVLAALIQHILH